MAYSNSTLGAARPPQSDVYPMEAPDRKPGGVEQAIDRQRDLLTTLEQAVGALTERVSPALLPSNPQAVCGNATEPMRSPVASSVEDANIRIRTITERVVDLIQRIDL